jgi:hypothetical protein
MCTAIQLRKSQAFKVEVAGLWTPVALRWIINMAGKTTNVRTE